MSDADAGEKASETRATAARVRRSLDYALLGGLVLLGVFAAIQFYFAADRTINVWVTREYRPPFKMVFNLVVLLVVGIGVSRQIRRLTGTDDDSDDSDSGPEAATDGGNATATTGTDLTASTVARETDRTAPTDGVDDPDSSDGTPDERERS